MNVTFRSEHHSTNGTIRCNVPAPATLGNPSISYTQCSITRTPCACRFLTKAIPFISPPEPCPPEPHTPEPNSSSFIQRLSEHELAPSPERPGRLRIERSLRHLERHQRHSQIICLLISIRPARHRIRALRLRQVLALQLAAMA